MYLECVDMGVSVMCPGLGLDPSYPLESPDNFSYDMSGDTYLNDENYIDKPHWRKFQVVGLEGLNPEAKLMFKHKSYYSSASNTVSIQYPEFHFLTPEIENGEVYFYMYEVYTGGGVNCASIDNIWLSIPEAHSWKVSSIGTQDWEKNAFEIYYETDLGYKPTGIIFDR